MIKTFFRLLVILVFIGWVATVGLTGAIQAVVGLGISIYHFIPGIYHFISSIVGQALGTNPNTIKP